LTVINSCEVEPKWLVETLAGPGPPYTLQSFYIGMFNCIATIARKIWLHKNTVVFGGELIHPSQLIKSAQEAMEDFKGRSTKGAN
jgi:hypothetical protein